MARRYNQYLAAVASHSCALFSIGSQTKLSPASKKLLNVLLNYNATNKEQTTFNASNHTNVSSNPSAALKQLGNLLHKIQAHVLTDMKNNLKSFRGFHHNQQGSIHIKKGN